MSTIFQIASGAAIINPQNIRLRALSNPLNISSILERSAKEVKTY